MIGHTNAYTTLRQQTDHLFDFVVVVCYGIPSLKKEIALASGDPGWTVPKPDFFINDKSSLTEVRDKAANYKSWLAAYIVLGSFSYFEAYFGNAIDEMLDFHGGKEAFLATALRRSGRFLQTTEPELVAHKRKLQEPAKDTKDQKYEKHTRELLAQGYRFPTELFSPYGIHSLYARVGRLRAEAIPALLAEAFHLKLPEPDVQRFHQIREVRNRIAHGRPVNLALGQAMDVHRDLRELARTIDQHLSEHFFVIEEFA